MKKITIGIDFSKEKFDVTVINIESSEIIQGQFVNKASGARDMIRMVKRFAKGTEASDWLFCGEDTGYYSQLVTRYLVKKGYFMWLQNPFAIKHSVGKIRRGKDDKTDSAMIAEYAQRFMDKAKSYELPSECIEQLRALLSKRDALVRAKKVIACGTGELPDLGKQTEAVTVIKATTKHLVNEIDKTIKKLEDKMREIINRDEEVKKNYDILTSFVGIGLINATSFIAYTENFTKYDLNARKIATAWGVAPFHQESGTSVHTQPHVSGFCNRWLKALLSNAANCAIKTNDIIRIYYDKLKRNGKCEGIARNNVKNKIIHIITAMIRNQQMFDTEYCLQKKYC